MRHHTTNMKIIKLTILFILNTIISFNSSCENINSDYKIENIKIINTRVKDDTLLLCYSIPLETMYYSPGINYSYNKKTKFIEIYVVRQKINSQKRVMVSSKLIENDSAMCKKNYYLIKIPLLKGWDIDKNNPSIQILNRK